MEDFLQLLAQRDAVPGNAVRPDCGANHPCISLGMAYVPPQAFEDLYDADMGLLRGTIFQKLDFPYLGREGAK